MDTDRVFTFLALLADLRLALGNDLTLQMDEILIDLLRLYVNELNELADRYEVNKNV